MHNKLTKKGYFFILDAFIAATIIAVSLVAILNSDVAVEQRTKDYAQADAIVQFLLDTKIEDIDNQYVKDLIANGNITNPRNTVMEQIDAFYYKANYTCSMLDFTCAGKNYNMSMNLLRNISEPIISQKYGYSYVIMDGVRNYTVYNRSLDTKNASDFRVVTKRISYVRLNHTALFRPHIVEFSLWTK